MNPFTHPIARRARRAVVACTLALGLSALSTPALAAPTATPTATTSAAPVVRTCDMTLTASDKQTLLQASDHTTLRSLDDVQQRLRTVTDTFVARGDARGTFPLVYQVIVAETAASIDEGKFADPVWADRLAIAFAGEYFRNLNAHLRGARTTSYWAEFYRLAANCDRSLARVLAQGIVNHLVDDLPRILTAVNTSAERKDDFDIYGASLVDATPRIIDDFNTTYGVDVSEPLQLYFLGDIFGTEAVNTGLFGLVRSFAWINHRKYTAFRPWGENGIALTWVAGSGAIGTLEGIGLV